MDVKEAMDQRISLRAYDQKPIEQEKLSQLQEAIDVANAQMAEKAPDHPAILTIEDPHLEDGTSVHMKNRSIVGPIYHYVAGYCEDAIARELIGYYGEKIVLLATQLGIGSCWIAETMDWKTLARDEYNGLKLGIIISIGYAPEKIPLKQEGIRTAIRLLTKKPAQIMTANGTPTEPEQMPEWFNRGINAVLACPTAINKLPVVFDLTDGVVSASMATSSKTMTWVSPSCTLSLPQTLRVRGNLDNLVALSFLSSALTNDSLPRASFLSDTFPSSASGLAHPSRLPAQRTQLGATPLTRKDLTWPVPHNTLQTKFSRPTSGDLQPRSSTQPKTSLTRTLR